MDDIQNRIAWNSAVNNATQLRASGAIDEDKFYDTVLEYYALILEVPNPTRVTDSQLLEMVVQVRDGTPIQIARWEWFSKNANEFQLKVVNEMKKEVKRTNNHKIKVDELTKQNNV